jgi:hypothetical protein
MRASPQLHHLGQGKSDIAKLTHKAVAAALMATHGNISAAARSLSVTRKAIQQRIKQVPGLQEAVTEARESAKDNIESALEVQALDGNIAAICFFLKTQAKERGYVEGIHELKESFALLVAELGKLRAEYAEFQRSNHGGAAAGGGAADGVAPPAAAGEKPA